MMVSAPGRGRTTAAHRRLFALGRTRTLVAAAPPHEGEGQGRAFTSPRGFKALDEGHGRSSSEAI